MNTGRTGRSCVNLYLIGYRIPVRVVAVGVVVEYTEFYDCVATRVLFVYCVTIVVMEYGVDNIWFRDEIREYCAAVAACQVITEGTVADFGCCAVAGYCTAVNGSVVAGYQAVKDRLRRGPAVEIDCSCVAAGRINTISKIIRNSAVADFCDTVATIEAAAVAVRGIISFDDTTGNRDVSIDEVQAATFQGCVANEVAIGECGVEVLGRETPAVYGLIPGEAAVADVYCQGCRRVVLINIYSPTVAPTVIVAVGYIVTERAVFKRDIAFAFQSAAVIISRIAPEYTVLEVPSTTRTDVEGAAICGFRVVRE
ncbi:hypothetical protein ES703_31440 [subsurface metagenome]